MAENHPLDHRSVGSRNFGVFLPLLVLAGHYFHNREAYEYGLMLMLLADSLAPPYKQ